MNRQEPYIGMPINFDDFDDAPMSRQPEQRMQATEQMSPSTDQMMRQPEQRMQSAESMQNMQGTQTAPNMQNMPNMQPMALAMAYVPWQRWTETYPLEEGLERGTIFPDLDMPFEGRRMGDMRR